MFLVLLALHSAYSSESCHHDASTFRCVRYVKNYDADTITVEIPDVHPLLGSQISVRVAGVDTPEMKGKLPCEKAAARSAQAWVAEILSRARRIDLRNVGRDKYFRILADVVVDGKSLGRLLLERRLAVAYDGGTKARRSWCERMPASE